jgi:hypothetical protein
MRRSSVLLLTLVVLTGCASQPRPYGALTSPPAQPSIIGVEVTNPFDRSIDVFYSTQLLGTLAPYAHGSYPVAPTTSRAPIYARLSGRATRGVNLSRSLKVRYVYEDPADPRSRGARRCTETVC